MASIHRVGDKLPAYDTPPHVGPANNLRNETASGASQLFAYKLLLSACSHRALRTKLTLCCTFSVIKPARDRTTTQGAPN